VKVFVFDLLPYSEHLDHLKVNGKLPWPLEKKYFKPEVAVQTYAEHLSAWEELERLGYDGVVVNEHHTSPYGLMNSPNLLAAALSQRTDNLKIAIYGNILPIHNPLRLAEELAMLDCMSNGRIISGFVRGIPREYDVFNIDPKESRARFDEAWEIIKQAWMEEVFSFEGEFWTFKNISIWPRPVQRPHPPVWVPVTISKESIEWAARHNFPITPGLSNHRGIREDIIRHYAKHLELQGHEITPDHLIITLDAYIADSKEQAFKEAGPYFYYYHTTLLSHGNMNESTQQSARKYIGSSAYDYLRPENLSAALSQHEDLVQLTMEKLRERVEHMAWGDPDEVRQRIIDIVNHAGANTVLISFYRGAIPHEMFINQLRRFAKEVLPTLKAYEVKLVPHVDTV
jgi:alkanesulfonate monooxygenase SsuD/methylene tetrahydromethanopterin reductase-like flavin-dependent oxidoreductase (luciferase family)